jgi:hypothetical protein
MATANDNLQRISGDESLQEDFFITFGDAFAEDDEPARKKFSRLYEAYRKNPSFVDDILMTLCGWTMATLAENTVK